MNEVTKLGGNGIEYTFLEDGSWLYKAVPLKRRAAEKPQIKAVEKIEENYQKFFDKRLDAIIRDIARYLG